MVVDKKILVLLQFFLILTIAYSVTLNTSYSNSTNEFVLKAEKLVTSLNKALDFTNRYYSEMNLDGALGIVLTEAQLLQSLKNTVNKETASLLLMFIEKCQVSRKIVQRMPNIPYKNILFARFLLKPHSWERRVKFAQSQLQDLGIYKSWTVQDILKNRTAQYGGVSSDECLREILEDTPNNPHFRFCPTSSRCQVFMFGKRNDTGYVLTHRLLYLYILRMVRCAVHQETIARTIKNYCSLILKEAKTNAFLGFPQHDIFLEQVVLCGMEGFAEFFQDEWTSSIVEWQTAEGCYKENGTFVNTNNNIHNAITSRSANVISFGCTDHATGLGAAALALNLRYTLQKLEL